MFSDSFTHTQTATQSAKSDVVKAQALAALLAGMLGLGLIYVAGFAETATVHNAAHDGRHSAGFPCH